MAKNEHGLTDKMELFCQERMVNGDNKSAAYREAYDCENMSDESINVNASKLASNAKVTLRYNELVKERNKRFEMDQDDVLRDIILVKNRCMQEVPVMVYDPESQTYNQKKDDDGKGVWQFDSGSALRALDMLGKNTGIYEKDNRQKNDTILIKMPDDD